MSRVRRGLPLRPALVALHRYAGLVMALFLVVAGLTGSVIAFHRELDLWLNPGLFRTEPRPAGEWSAGAVAALVERSDPRVRVSFVALDAAADRAVEVFVLPRTDPATGMPYALDYTQLFVDPARERILGRRDYGACCFAPENLIPFLYEFHYTLHLPGLWGVWLMGGVALLWLFDCFVGLWLTLPRGRPFIAKWRPAWLVKWRGGGYRINFDLHRAGGLWLWIALLLIAVSGVALNLHDEVFEPVVASVAEVTPEIFDRRAPVPEHDDRIDWDAALAAARAEARHRGWPQAARSIFHDRTFGFYGINFGDDDAAGLGPRTLQIGDGDGKTIGDVVPGTGTAGDFLHEVQFPLHSGRIAGLAGRIVIAVIGVAVAMLSVTGIVIWMRKRQARKHRVRRPLPIGRGS